MRCGAAPCGADASQTRAFARPRAQPPSARPASPRPVKRQECRRQESEVHDLRHSPRGPAIGGTRSRRRPQSQTVRFATRGPDSPQNAVASMPGLWTRCCCARRRRASPPPKGRTLRVTEQTRVFPTAGEPLPRRTCRPAGRRRPASRQARALVRRAGAFPRRERAPRPTARRRSSRAASRR